MKMSPNIREVRKRKRRHWVKCNLIYVLQNLYEGKAEAARGIETSPAVVRIGTPPTPPAKVRSGSFLLHTLSRPEADNPFYVP